MSFSGRTTAKQIVDHYKPDLKGKVALVTGGNSGIGTETCKALCSAGAKVILCTRKLESGVDTVDNYIKVDSLSGYAVPDANVVVKQLDLADLNSVKRLAEELNKEEPKIDFLVLNAGVMACPLAHTVQGFEMQIGTNHFGHFYLTTLLADNLKKSNARIISLSSSAHRYAQTNFLDDMHFKNKKYSAWGSYGNSKVANIFFAKSLADQGFRAYSVHPGVINTNLGRYMLTNSVFKTIFGGICSVFGKTIPQGAATTLYACLSTEIEDKPGAFLADCKVCKPSSFGEDADKTRRTKLWETTHAEINEKMGE